MKGGMSCVEAAASGKGCWRQNDPGVGDLLSLHSAVCSILCAVTGGFMALQDDAFKAIWTLTWRQSCNSCYLPKRSFLKEAELFSIPLRSLKPDE
jgi:hypothetical protein